MNQAFLNLKNIKFIFGGACTSKINGNLNWNKYCIQNSEKVKFFESVLNTLYFANNKDSIIADYKFFGDGMCDLVSEAILLEIVFQRLPFRFEWASSIFNGTHHVFLYDLDEKVYVDLTAVQFFPQWQAVVGTRQEFEDMGHEMGIDDSKLASHFRFNLEELSKLLIYKK